MNRWEYIRIQTSADKIKSTDDKVDELGMQGWELVDVVFTNTYIHMWFKRPK
jgi:hypothetical protein